jgi:2-iminobutanoate/2-iminopropanoate deaminase
MLGKVDRKVIATEKAPTAAGPYSQAIVSGKLVFTAGQLPLNPVTNKIAAGDFESQLRQVMHNLEAVLQAAGTNLKNVVKFTVFLTDLKNFAALNKVFAEYFPEAAPARSAFQVSRLPLDVLVEIEAVAALETE